MRRKFQSIFLSFFFSVWILSAFIFLRNEWYYLHLVEEICQRQQGEKEKAIAIFNWTVKNIKAGKVDLNLPWFFLTSRKIIERGKGLCSESARVFITLCQKAGLKARRVSLYSAEFDFSQTTGRSSGSHGIAEVYIEGRWVVFDTFWGKFFLVGEDRLASIKDIQENPWIVDDILPGINPPLSEYYYKVQYINWNHYSWLIKVHSLGYHFIGERIDGVKVPYLLWQPELLFFSLLTFLLIILLIPEGLLPRREINAEGICMVIAHFPPTVGGTERQAKLLAQHLQKRGYQVLVATMRLSGEKAYEDLKSMEVHRILSHVYSRRSSPLFLLFLTVFLIRKMKRYGIIHAHLASSPALVGVLVGLILRKKRVLKLGASREYGDMATSEKTWKGRFKLWLLKRTVQKFIVTNQEMRDELLVRGFRPEGIELIPNGVDTEKFIPLGRDEEERGKERMGFKEERFVTFIGRLEPQKDVETLIKAWSELKDRFPHILLIVGEGSAGDYLKGLVKQLKMEERVVFVGRVPPEEILLYHQLADVFVLPSLSEGTSNSLLEAMSCAKAVLATRIGGNCEVIEEGVDGLLFSPGDTLELVRMLETLLIDEDKRELLGKKAREKMVKNYSFPLITSRYIELYRGLKEGD
jgi:glycosyltransferase involved in cell wall biosynthesis